jgi:hypothetical protein
MRLKVKKMPMELLYLQILPFVPTISLKKIVVSVMNSLRPGTRICCS